MRPFSLIPRYEQGELARFRREMDGLFDRFFEGWPFKLPTRPGEWAPSVDVSETPKQFIVKAEIPGMDPGDMDVSVHGDVLTLTGERKKEHEEKGENIYQVERSYGAFSRSIRLPAEVAAEKVTATYKDGVLKIHLPKIKQKPVKRIEVKVT
jgi:HSP20 family protein